MLAIFHHSLYSKQLAPNALTSDALVVQE